MSFIDNIKKCIGLSESDAFCDFRLVSFGFNSLYFEKIKQIISYNKEEINLGLKSGGIKIIGENLYVKKYCAGDVVVCGKIKSIERF